MSYMEKFGQTSASLDRMGLIYKPPLFAPLSAACTVLNPTALAPAGFADWY